MTHEQILFSIAGGLFGLTGGLVGVILSNFNKRIDTNTTDNNDIKTNYTDRFDSVKNLINEKHIETMTAINGLDVKMATDFMTKSECYFKHKDQ